jgi:hypothetical protein
MRTLVFLLALANLLFFAYARGYFSGTTGADALRLQEQVNPERLKVLPPTPSASPAPGAAAEPAPAAPEAPAMPAEAQPAAGAAPVAAQAQPPAARLAEAAQPKPVPEAEPAAPPGKSRGAPACLQLTGLSAEQAGKFAAQAAAGRLQVIRHEEGGWWVLIPPLADKATADKKAGELQRLGLDDFFVVGEGAQKNAISLGVFSRQEAAEKRLADLRGRGVRSARIVPRALGGARQTLDVKGEAGALATFRKTLPDGIAARDCP